MNNKNLDRLIQQALAIESEEAKEAGALGYMARALVQASMPHSRPEGLVFERTNGAFSLVMMGHPHAGLPYGTVPRLLLAWLTTEAVRTRERELVLGDTLSRFMAQLDMIPTGGRWGTITRLRDQMRRLFASTVSCTYDAPGTWALETVTIADRARLWWDPKQPDQAALWASSVTLSDRFFHEVTDRPIPIDLRALKALKRSPMALDLYTWLTYRMSYLERLTEIPWGALQLQFGADYPYTPQGTADFKRKALAALKKVLAVYPKLRASDGPRGLRLLPSPSHVRGA